MTGPRAGLCFSCHASFADAFTPPAVSRTLAISPPPSRALLGCVSAYTHSSVLYRCDFIGGLCEARSKLPSKPENMVRVDKARKRAQGSGNFTGKDGKLWGEPVGWPRLMAAYKER